MTLARLINTGRFCFYDDREPHRVLHVTPGSRNIEGRFHDSYAFD